MKTSMIVKILALSILCHFTIGQTVFLKDSAYDITSPSSTTPVYHLIKLTDSQIKDLSRDEKQALVQGLINRAANSLIHLVETEDTKEDMKPLPAPIVIENIQNYRRGQIVTYWPFNRDINKYGKVEMQI